MNNYVYGAPADIGMINNRKGFRAAQNRIAALMFFVFALMMGSSVIYALGINFFPGMTTSTFRSELIQAIMYLGYMAVPVILFGILRGKRPGVYFCFRRGKKHTVAVGFAAMGIIYFAQLCAVIMSDLFSAAGIDLNAASMQTTTEPAVIILRVIYVAVFPAIFEELVTRGIVLGELLPYGKGFAIITSGVLFALMHGNPIQLPFAFIAGVTMAYSVVACGTMRVSVVIHFMNNFLSVLFMSLPEIIPKEIAYSIEAAVSVLIFVFGAAALLYLLKCKKKEKASQNADRDPADTPPAPAVRDKWLCTVDDEPCKVDLRGGVLRNVTPLLYVYAVIMLFEAFSTLITLAAMPAIQDFMEGVYGLV
ncbi:MAG: CPBP family intramembrane metalloprotease [Clostridia bacterium]|nr:CPBP family intramembrane metalloprotease [Clostridia bacterium]